MLHSFLHIHDFIIILLMNHQDRLVYSRLHPYQDREGDYPFPHSDHILQSWHWEAVDASIKNWLLGREMTQEVNLDVYSKDSSSIHEVNKDCLNRLDQRFQQPVRYHVYSRVDYSLPSR